MALELPSNKSETVSFSNKPLSYSDGVEDFNQNSLKKRLIGRRNSKSFQSQDDPICEKVKFTEKAVSAQKHRNKIGKALHEMEFLPCKVDVED